MITMALGGLWHGAAWTFVLWGLYQGTVLVIARLIGGMAERAGLVIREGLNPARFVLGLLMFLVTFMPEPVYFSEPAPRFPSDEPALEVHVPAPPAVDWAIPA